ncbi:glycosyltransferase [Akkermansiaceae bacterium]|nr:glycosyltransferase [Akkermansiaceae bacterium]
MKRLLFVSNLFPDSANPIRGLDNSTLLHSLGSGWEIRVLSPRPAMPPWRREGALPRGEDLAFSPRYVGCPYVPKVGSWCNDRLMAMAMAPAFARLVKDFRPEAVLCSWLYPDGCAVARLAGRHRLPLVLVTQGTDTHGYLRIPARRRSIVSAISRSSAVICRSGNLAHRLQEAGVAEGSLKVIYNGVDTGTFRPRERDGARRELGLDPQLPVLLFVGNYLPVKNPMFLIRAHAELNRRRAARGMPPARLVLIGDGPLRPTMQDAVAAAHSVTNVDLRGREVPREVARWMNAADLLCLSSHNEGFPNVILEAMASGLRVVSTDVGGIGELVTHRGRGLLVGTGDLDAYAGALEEALEGGGTEPQSAGIDDWSWAGAAKKYAEVIESAIQAPACVRM